MRKEYLPVLNKRDGADRYRKGEFGNASPSWDRLDQFFRLPRRDRHTRLFHLRNQDSRGGGAVTHYNQTWLQCVEKWKAAERPEDWYVSEMVPKAVENTLVIQGEVMQDCFRVGGGAGLYLLYSTVPGLPMREGLKAERKEATGIRAIETLKYLLPPEDWDWLNILLDRYPTHVVEFSCFGQRWGTLNERTLWWEVRSY